MVQITAKNLLEKNSIVLREMENVERVMIVCDPGMVQFGYCDTVREVLARRKNDVKIEVFSDVEPNPSTNTAYAGTKLMADFKPDTVIALEAVLQWTQLRECGCSMNTQTHLFWCKTKFWISVNGHIRSTNQKTQFRMYPDNIRDWF